MNEREILLKVFSELKTTLSEIKKDKAGDFKSDGRYVFTSFCLNIKNYAETTNAYNLDFDTEIEYKV